MAARDECAPCPFCSGPMHVQKTILRGGRTLEHGSFQARETVHACAARCRHPDGTLVTRRAQVLQDALVPGRSVGYDVMVLVGMERWLRHRQREEIQALLLNEHGVRLSTGSISELARLFGVYLRTLHEARAGELRAALESDGGYPLHVDATGESGRGTMLVALAGWRGWVLGSWKIETERADAILPRLREVVAMFGPPCAVVRDLGRAMIPATGDLVAGLERPVPILACHAHFLADVGKDLLEASHAELRGFFRRHKVRSGLRGLARELGRKLGEELDHVRGAVQSWMSRPDTKHALPEDGCAGLGGVRALAQWVLDFPDASTGADFPFDRPYLELHDRCVQVRRAIDAFLRQPPEDKRARRALRRLARVLDPVVREAPFTQAARTLRKRAALFDELRDALRLQPTKPDEATCQPGDSERELNDIRAAVDELVRSLRQRRPRRGPAQDTRQAIDEIFAHLDRHGDHLWGHVIALPEQAGGGVAIVSRTNNDLEGFFRGVKQGERRRSGRKNLTADLELLPPEAALAQNLRHHDYAEILCGDLDRLPCAFAELDADRRRRARAGDPPPELPQPCPEPEIVSASLPRLDRRLVRQRDMGATILAAARSRAPRVDTMRARG